MKPLIALISLATIALFGKLLSSSKPKVFVSYDHSEDAHYKRLLQAWDANQDFDFEFDSRGPNEAIESDSAGVIKSVLTKKMKEATHLLVIVGEKSHSSKWMAWEIERAKKKDTNLKLVGIKIKKTNKTPKGLLNSGATWATSFQKDRIIAALKGA